MTDILRCRKHPDTILEWDTHDGRAFSSCVKCGRHARRECIDCGRSHGGLTHQRQRCWVCARRKRYDDNNRRRARECRNPECLAMVTPGTKQQFCSHKCRNRLKTIRFQKKMDRNPTLKAKVLGRKKRWRDRNPKMLMAYKRKGRLDGTWGYRSREAYLAAMKAQNLKPSRASRGDSERIYGPNNRPRCEVCRRVIAWSGMGRPRKRHPKCTGVAA